MNTEQNPSHLTETARFKVVEILSTADTDTREITLQPVGVPAFDDYRVKLVVVTADPDVLKALQLGSFLNADGDVVDIQASAASAIGNALKHFGKGIAQAFGFVVTETEKTAAEQAVIAFVGHDGLQLAEDAVAYVGTLANLSGVEARDAAVAKFKADAAVAKKDLTHLASAAFNFIIEGALQIAINKGLVLLTAAATTAIAAA